MKNSEILLKNWEKEEKTKENVLISKDVYEAILTMMADNFAPRSIFPVMVNMKNEE